ALLLGESHAGAHNFIDDRVGKPSRPRTQLNTACEISPMSNCDLKTGNGLLRARKPRGRLPAEAYSPDDPDRLADVCLARRRGAADGPVVRRWQGGWYCWDGNCFVQRSDEEFRALLRPIITARFEKLYRKDNKVRQAGRPRRCLRKVQPALM